MSDASIIRKLKKRDEKTFAKFFNSYKNLVFYEANIILNNKMDAEDITQEVFIEFFNRIDELKEDTNLKLYIASLSKRRAIDQYRRNSKSRITYVEEIENFVDINPSITPTLTLDGVLKLDEAHIVTLKAVHEFSFKEIAISLNMTIGQVQGIYYHAIKKLRKHYKKGN